MDSIKVPVTTITHGVGGILLSLWDALPGILRVCILLATLVHIIVRIRKDLK